MSNVNDFINKYRSAAETVSKETGISVERILGQAGLESGWNVNAPGHNFFGVKAHGGGKSIDLATHEADENGNLVPTTASFRAYDDPADSFRDWANVVGQDRYKAAMQPGLNDADYAAALKAGGYATDRDYAAKLAGTIATAKNALNGTSFGPDTPTNVNVAASPPAQPSGLLAAAPAQPAGTGLLASTADDADDSVTAPIDLAGHLADRGSKGVDYTKLAQMGLNMMQQAQPKQSGLLQAPQVAQWTRGNPNALKGLLS